jgi:ATP-dependent helicase/nuclease subunit A
MNHLPQQASDPDYSLWVAASAGTGKTKILTDRVIRLLISGVAFNKILCLTFTNAAALEMQHRIKTKLAQFAEINIAPLTKELSLLLGKNPSESELDCARNLYHKLLNSNEAINIYTIHAFCQKILKLFPFEAGINPGFQILDDITVEEILDKIRNQIYLDPVHHNLINFFLTNFHEITINDIFVEIIQHKLKFKKLFVRKISEPLHILMLDQLTNLYDQARQLLIKYLIIIDSDQAIQQLFLTKDFSKRKNILAKSIALKYPELLKSLEHIQEEIFQLDQQIKMQDLENYSYLLTKLAQIFLDKYDDYKAKHSLLDYDDLIYLTQILLTDNNSREWVLYKLDGGIDHLLVDEAQDTSPQQWQIILAIIAEFYSPYKQASSIFVVGDEKQSIFSFQGANLANFANVNQNLADNLSRANKNFKNITLEWSYRSTGEIIDIVYLILQQIQNTSPELFPIDNPKILPFRHTDNGKVEVWPLITSSKNSQLFWPLPEDHHKFKSSQQLLAKQIASFIKTQIASQKILPATGLPIKEADFMILVRKRDELIFEIIDSLKQHGLLVEDIDRITLNQNLSVLDLISIAKFVLLPQDDLNLACLLKSPIINISEEELQNIAISRGKSSIWDFLQNQSYEHLSKKLNYFIQISKVTDYGHSCKDFFSFIVDSFGIRQVLVESNGFDSNDMINELIYLSSNYAGRKDSSLQSFIYWFENTQIEIKRNLDSSNKIKIMTVHASKGLQAPIVILCDTTSVPTNSNKFIWTEDGRIFSASQSLNSPNFFKELKEQERQKGLQEYIRLLYVALTRAQDHLIICGYLSSSSKLPQNCWYELVTRAMHPNEQIKLDNLTIPQTDPEATANNYHDLMPEQPICFANDLLIDKITRSSKSRYPAISPLIINDYLEYGKIFHKMLEDSARINDFTILNQHPFIEKLTVKFQQKIRLNIDKLLNNKEFMALEKQQLKTELTIGVNLHNDSKIGRIDLLACNHDSLTIIDYKSDAIPPKTCRLLKESYLDQLNFYRHTIQRLYPHKKIICKILWLENAHFMTIDP